MTRSKHLFLATIVAASLVAVPSAIARPADNGPIDNHRGTANVYAPPADLSSPEARAAAAAPEPPQGSANPNAFLHVSSDNGDVPWLAIGLGLGCVVLLAGCAVGLRRTQRRRTAA